MVSGSLKPCTIHLLTCSYTALCIPCARPQHLSFTCIVSLTRSFVVIILVDDCGYQGKIPSPPMNREMMCVLLDVCVCVCVCVCVYVCVWCLPKKTHFVPKTPRFCTKKAPPDTKKPPIGTKKPPTDPTDNQYAPPKTLFVPKSHLLSPCMLHLWTVVYQKAPLVTPFCTKTLGWVTSGFPPFHHFLQLSGPPLGPSFFW